jgi:hypothetical protein
VTTLEAPRFSELQPSWATAGGLSAAASPALPVPRPATWMEEPFIVSDGGKLFLGAPAERDPQRGPDGRHPMPAKARAELRRYAAAGHRFDRIAIVHELDPQGPVAVVLPVLRQGPVTCSDAVARAVVGPVPDHPATARAARSLDALVGRGTRAVGAALSSRPGLLLDPVVFGVVGVGGSVPRDGELATWYPLCGWMW